MRTAALLSVLSVISGGCPSGGEPDLDVEARRDEAADAMFHQEPRWLGGDGAYSIDLGGDRSLWLFGDSFIATSPALTRRQSKLVRNSVAVMTGRDPEAAVMVFAWRDGSPPSSFFPEDGDRWYWPIHGVRIPDGPLVVFLARLRPTPGDGLGFAGDGYRAVRIADPSGPPGAWVIEPLEVRPVPGQPEATIGNCAFADEVHLYAVSVDGDHRARLVRYPLAALAAGELSSAEWLTRRGFVREAALGEDTPRVVMDGAGTECSLFPSDAGYTYVASEGFGGTTIGFRFGAEPGDLGGPIDVFTPPESRGERPFVYAGKAHAQLADASRGEYLVTYADNSFRFEDLFDPARERTLYWPKIVRVRVRARFEAAR